MIFKFTLISKRGKGDLYKKKTISFILILTRGTRVLLKIIIQVKGNKSPFVIYRFKYIKFIIIKNIIII